MLDFRCLQDDILNNFCVMYLYLMIEVIILTTQCWYNIRVFRVL